MPRTPMESLRRTLTLGGLSAAAVVSARVLFKPHPAEVENHLLDWDTVRLRAHARSGERGPLLRDDARAATYNTMARELAPAMADVLGAEPTHFPHFQALDRRGFVDANLVIMERLLAPIEKVRSALPESHATAISRHLLSRYMGELLGFMSQRVFGQYDPVLQMAPPPGDDTTPTSLFLVETNLANFERAQGVPADALRRWLILHELTHAWQFESHPWLRDHIADVMRELMMGALMQPSERGQATPVALPSSREIVTKLPETVRLQLRGVARVQAIMSVLEGYSNFVMHRVGAAHLEHFDTLEKAFHARKAERTMLERFVITVTGINMKMRQYEIGEKFASAVTERAGLATLNLVWTGPETMPSMAELRDPERWIRRVG